MDTKIDWLCAPEEATHALAIGAGTLYFRRNPDMRSFSIHTNGRWLHCDTRIDPEKLIKRESKNLDALLERHMINIATLSGALYGWVETDDYKSTYHYIADSVAGHDAQRGGCLRLAIAVMSLLDEMIDWEHPHPGVFSYDHLEMIPGGIPLLLINKMSRDAWAELACNHTLPRDLKKWLSAYIRSTEGLRLVGDPEPRAGHSRCSGSGRSDMKVKVTELSGAALDWAVAMAQGHTEIHVFGKSRPSDRGFIHVRFNPEPKAATARFEPSENWEYGGPIIEKEQLCVGCQHQPDPNYCPILDPNTLYWARTTSGGYLSYGPTPLIAAMRCYVRSKLGDEVDIPDALSGGPHA